DARGRADVEAMIMSNGLDRSIAERGERALEQAGGIRVRMRIEQARSVGIGLTIWQGGAGFPSLGQKGKPMEEVVSDALKDRAEWLATEATVDEHLADQLVLPALFARGESRWRASRVTEHLRTVLWVAGHFVDFDYALDEGTGLVSIRPR